MATTPQQRLFLVSQAYGQARNRRPRDLKDAASEAQARAILKNCDRLEAQYLEAATDALAATGAAVEAAYDDARAAQDAIDAAYAAAVDIADRIRMVGDIIGKVGTLIKAANG